MNFFDSISPFWDNRFMTLAEHIAQWSSDESTKVGCVIVDIDNNICATGYNGTPRNFNNYIEHENFDKYLWTEHAERNAIFQAARRGVKIEGCRLYSTLFPCADCARAIIQSGISQVYAPAFNYEDKSKKHWFKSMKASEKMLHLLWTEFNL